MSNELIASEKESDFMSPEKVDLIRKTICKDATNEELQMFFHACKKSGLDPLMKQIYFVKRGGKGAIQLGIDGYRLIADRTNRYAPGSESTFTYDKEGKLVSATAHVKKLTHDGTWHDISATAFYNEYKPAYQSDFWSNKPHIMLSKCAEALALRKAFPSELSGMYVKEELDQGQVLDDDTITVDSQDMKPTEPIIPRDELINMVVEKTGYVEDQFKDYLVDLEKRCIGKVPSFYDALKMSIEDPKRIVKGYTDWKAQPKLKKEMDISKPSVI
jgi:phage recombination protein Bet